VASVSFYGGVGRIGSTKVVVSQEGYRAVFDLGLLVPNPENPLQAVRLEPGRELAARLAFGEAPGLPHLYRREALEGTGLAGGSDGRTALFVSHCHVDHMGLLGWVDPDVPIYAAPETVAMVAALEAAGQPLEGGSPQLTALAEGEQVQVGPMTVQRVAVDHDVPGASGFLAVTDDGVVAYSGDIRLHGRHPERSLRFAEKARGAAALVVEATTISFDPAAAPVSEGAVEEAYDRALGATPGVVLQCLYPRDTERVLAFAEIAASHGREVLWPEELAKFLTAYGLTGVQALDDQALRAAASSPGRYAVQVPVEELGRLLSLPLGPGSVCLHANGEPLGPFHQPKWDILQSWLEHLHVPFVPIGTGGHLTPADLDDLVWLIRPETVYPVHTADPYRLAAPPGARRVLPEYSRAYRVAGGAIVRDGTQ
jgi:ribonuclease J